jgi:hypothetical protein
VVDGPEPDERLGDAVDGHRGHDPDVDVGPGRERTPEHERVHDGAEHPDVVRLGPADAPALGHPAAEVVAAPDHHRHLNAKIPERQNLLRDPGQAVWIDTGVRASGERLTAELDDDPAIAWQVCEPPSGPPKR